MNTHDSVPAVSSRPDDPLSKLRIDRTGTARRRRRPWALIVAGLLVLVIGAAVLNANREALSAPQVRIGRATRIGATEGSVETTANGYVVARRRAAISSKLSGRLDELLVDVGDRVAAGQLIGRLGHADLDAAVAQAKADIEVRRRAADAAVADRDAAVQAVAATAARLPEIDTQVAEMEARLSDAKRVLAMQEKLLHGGAGSRDAVDAARTGEAVMEAQLERARRTSATLKAEIERLRAAARSADAAIETARSQVPVAEAALAQAEAMRRDADIVAPFGGVVVRKEAEVGEMVAPVNAAGSTTRGAVVSLVDFATLEMEVDVIERDIAKVREGGVCRIVLDARRDSPYVGVVRQKVPTADRTTSTIEVKVGFKTLDAFVLPEMGGRVEFLAEGKDAVATAKDRVLAPAAAFTTRDGAEGVFVSDKDRVTFVKAAKGEADGDGTVRVASGLAGGEDVVLDPPPTLAPGMLIRTAKPDAK